LRQIQLIFTKFGVLEDLDHACQMFSKYSKALIPCQLVEYPNKATLKKAHGLITSQRATPLDKKPKNLNFTQIIVFYGFLHTSFFRYFTLILGAKEH